MLYTVYPYYLLRQGDLVKFFLNGLLITFLSNLMPLCTYAKDVRYQLVVTKQSVNLSGKKSVNFALTVNGGIPAPILEFTEGDNAEIIVKNEIPDDELSIHWHGLLLPPEMDGVPYVNTPPIRTGESFTFKFKIRQHGTFWYHSHTNVQEQKGVYGAIVIHPKRKTIHYNKDIVAVLSDWSDEDASNILKNLKKDGDYYLYKKDTIRSWLGAIKANSLSSYLKNEWTRMGGMDLSDVGYDAFLINGKKDIQLSEAHPGDKIRLRIINAAASSYFYVSLGDMPMKVISADGINIKPILANEILLGMAETYDILFEIPDHKNYEFRVTAQDGTGSASGWIGMGEKIAAFKRPKPNIYMSMDHSSMDMNEAPMDHSKMINEKPKTTSMQMGSGPMDHSKMGQKTVYENHSEHKMKNKDISTVSLLTVDEISSNENSELPSSAPIHDVKLVLDGDMERYVWHINGKAIHEDRTLFINTNERVRFTFVNKSMMHHPMHLHGHFFRVINKSKEFSPLKHTVDVAPNMTRVIEFYANEPGEWMLHCHNLYHLKTGMARVVKYSSFVPGSQIAPYQKHDPHLHDHRYFYGSAEASSNHAEGYLRYSNTWDQLEARIEGANINGNNFTFNNEWDYEADLFYRRWKNRFFNFILGATSFGEDERAVVGFGYLLPMLIETNWLINHEGEFRVDAAKRFQWSSTIFSDIDLTWRPDQKGEHETEIEISLMYSPSWTWAAGAMLTNDSLGAGLEFQF